MAIKKVIQVDLTITQSKIKIKDLEKQVKSLDGRTLKYRQALQKLRLEEQKLQAVQKQRAVGGKTLIKANQNLAKSTKKVVDTSGLANTAVQELGRGASDSAFGIQGMANNASQLGSLFGTLVQKTGSTMNALKAMGAAMLGPLGLVVIFQALTAVVQTNWFNALLAGGQAQKDLNDTMKEGSKIAGESVTEFRLLTDVLLDKTASDEDQARAVRVLNKDFKEFNTELITNATNYKNARAAVDNFTLSLIAQAKAEAALTLIKEKQGQILLLEEEKQKKIRETGAKDEADLDRVKIEAQKSLAKALKKIRESGIDAGDSIGGISPEEQKEILGKRFDNLKEFNKDEIAELQESIKVLSKLGDIRKLILSGGDEKDNKSGKTDEEKIAEINNKFRLKNEDALDILEVDKLERQKKRDLKELERLGAYWEDKLALNRYYDDLIKKANGDIVAEHEENIRIEGDNEIQIEEERLKNLFDLGQKEIFGAKVVADAKKKIRDANLNNIASGFRTLSSLFNKNKGLQISSIIAENAVGIAKNIVNTQAANQAAVAQGAALAIPTGGLSVTAAAAIVAANNISSGVSIAASVAAAAKGISALGGGGSSSGVGGSSSGGSNKTTSPSFNLVQGTQGNQISNAITQGNQSPTQAFVVGSAVTTSQELERNKLDIGSI